jgi:hypothetical protein
MPVVHYIRIIKVRSKSVLYGHKLRFFVIRYSHLTIMPLVTRYASPVILSLCTFTLQQTFARFVKLVWMSSMPPTLLLVVSDRPQPSMQGRWADMSFFDNLRFYHSTFSDNLSFDISTPSDNLLFDIRHDTIRHYSDITIKLSEYIILR